MPRDLVWQYFIALEADFAKCARYVEVAPDNFATYSVEFAKVLLAAGSEVDVVCRAICARIGVEADGINDYRAAIVQSFPGLPSVKVIAARYHLERQPWLTWSRGANPTWWSAYNQVKHHRHVNYPQANLKNALDALGGLMVVALYLHRIDAIGEPLEPPSQVIDVEQQDYTWIGVADHYRLPGAEPDNVRRLVV